MSFTFDHDKLRTAMRVRGLTGDALAEAAGINRGVVTSALRHSVQMRSARAIAKALEAAPVSDSLTDLGA